MDPAPLLDVLTEAVAVVQRALATVGDWRPMGDRDGQYALDLVADGPVCDHLIAHGLGVLSEESGLHHPDRDIVVVVDPVDGSTNASRRIPYYATSLCAVDADGPLVGLVVNLATGERWDAIRGEGARFDGELIHAPGTTELGDALIAFNGLPDRHWGWAQYRAFGAAALDLCAVASGRVDAYDSSTGPLKPWDYLAGALICTEAGAVVEEASGQALTTLDFDARRAPIAAATPELLAAIRGVHAARS